MSDTEIKIKSSELNSVLLKFLTLLTGALVGVLTWLGTGLFSAQQRTAEAAIIMGVRMDAVQKKLDDTMGKHEFDLELSGIKTRMGAIEIRQSALDLEIQKLRKL